MLAQLAVYAVPPKDPRSDPRTHSVSSQPPVTPVSGDLMPSSGLKTPGILMMHICTYRQNTHTHKINKSLKD